jgi:hypothetical protein
LLPVREHGTSATTPPRASGKTDPCGQYLKCKNEGASGDVDENKGELKTVLLFGCFLAAIHTDPGRWPSNCLRKEVKPV